MSCTGCALCLQRLDLNVDTPGRTYTLGMTLAELVGTAETRRTAQDDIRWVTSNGNAVKRRNGGNRLGNAS